MVGAPSLSSSPPESSDDTEESAAAGGGGVCALRAFLVRPALDDEEDDEWRNVEDSLPRPELDDWEDDGWRNAEDGLPWPARDDEEDGELLNTGGGVWVKYDDELDDDDEEELGVDLADLEDFPDLEARGVVCLDCFPLCFVFFKSLFCSFLICKNIANWAWTSSSSEESSSSPDMFVVDVGDASNPFEFGLLHRTFDSSI